MAKVTAPPDFQIAALRKDTGVRPSLMTPGAGTPWEDRGAGGLIGAYFRTVTMSLTSPVKLLWSIRRPETTSDVNGFILASGAAWGVGVAELVWFLAWRAHDEDSPWMLAVAALIAGPFVFWALLQVALRLYLKLAAVELKDKLSPALAQNAFGYAAGPSLLAILPLVGMPLAALWILGNLAVPVGVKRFYMRPGGGIITAIMSTFATAIVVGLAYFLGRFIIVTLPAYIG